MDILFDNKRVLVTGAGRGIGRSLALAFAKGKAEKVFALSRTKSHLDSLVAEDARITPVVVDLSDWSAAKNVVESLGRIDILVNNAAILMTEPFLAITSRNFDMHFNINLKSILMISQAVAKGMVERKQGGSIVNVTSNVAKVGVEGLTVYAGTKGALEAASRVMATELGKHQIRVNCVSPGLVRTDMTTSFFDNSTFMEQYIPATPLGRPSEPEDIVNVILFVCSEKASMVHGQTLLVNGGWLAT